jgi:hypothetical protein
MEIQISRQKENMKLQGWLEQKPAKIVTKVEWIFWKIALIVSTLTLVL